MQTLWKFISLATFNWTKQHNGSLCIDGQAIADTLLQLGKPSRTWRMRQWPMRTGFWRWPSNVPVTPVTPRTGRSPTPTATTSSSLSAEDRSRAPASRSTSTDPWYRPRRSASVSETHAIHTTQTNCRGLSQWSNYEGAVKYGDHSFRAAKTSASVIRMRCCNHGLMDDFVGAFYLSPCTLPKLDVSRGPPGLSG